MHVWMPKLKPTNQLRLIRSFDFASAAWTLKERDWQLSFCVRVRVMSLVASTIGAGGGAGL